MQLIFMRGTHAQVRAISINRSHVVLFATLILSVLTGLFVGGVWVAARYGSEIPVLADWSMSRQLELQFKAGENEGPLDAMAMRLAEMQAQLARLDAVSARLLHANGMETKLQVGSVVGQGGLKQADERSLSVPELLREFKDLNARIDRQSDVLSIIDSDMQTARARFQGIPNESPLGDPVSVSRFGNRIDPFTGKTARHEGIDFIAPIGTPILAAAAGVVVKSAMYPGYGNLVEIEHNDNTVTRYGHASKLLVEVGDIVRLGQQIALVGSTGRSTGPHLHFEVRVNGVAKDPQEFLAKNGLPRPGPSTMAALNGLLSESAQPLHE